MTLLLAVAVACGLIQALAACLLVARFARRNVIMPSVYPGVTVLKPLYGDEPLLEQALATLCQQDYPDYQIVFGIQNPADPAAAVVERLRSLFPKVDIALVVDPARHGANGKVSNLINMLPVARNDVLVIADSDVHASPDYLSRLVGTLLQPGVGLVTSLYAGVRSSNSFAARLGATQITHSFLPGAVLARALGRNDCLGATMGLRRTDLLRIGGLQALVNHLADDQVLGRRISALGLHVVLAQTVVLTTVPETSLRTLFVHELRWARTIRALEPIAYTASVLQYPLAWALLTVVLSGGALWAVGLFMVAWVLRAGAAMAVDQALVRLEAGVQAHPRSAGHVPTEHTTADIAFSCPVWLLPLRDVLSVFVMMASYGGRRVTWRGHGLKADTPRRYAGAAAHPFEGSQTR